MKRSMEVAALCLLWLACTGHRAASVKQEERPGLDRLLAQVVRETGVPGLGAALVVDGEVAQVAVSGLRRADGTDSLQREDRFHLGSDTKAMTASVVARLVDQGVLQWDDTVSRLLGEDATTLHPGLANVTLEDLLRHTAGLPGEGGVTAALFEGFDPGAELAAQRRWISLRLLALPPGYAPRSRFAYSNWGYLVVGHLLERTTGKPWETLMAQEVFEPLGMQGCGFGPTATTDDPAHNWGHTVKDSTFVPTDNDNPAFLGPAGTAHCPLDAWARFAAAHLGAAPQWLSQNGLHHLHTGLPLPGLPPGKTAIALGWGVAQLREQAALVHDGSNGNNLARVVLLPSQNAALLVTCNAGDARAERAIESVTQALLDRLVGG